MTATYADLINAFVGVMAALVMNVVLIVVAEVRARTVTGISAVPEDNALKQRFGLVPPSGAAAESEAAPFATSSSPAAKPDALLRANNAHNNATENLVIFTVAAVSYVMAYGAQLANPNGSVSASSGIAMFIIFAIARWGHTITYFGGWQPFRTIFYLVGLFDTVVLMFFAVAAAKNIPTA